MCGGGVRSILLLPLVTGCIETIDVCIWCMFYTSHFLHDVDVLFQHFINIA